MLNLQLCFKGRSQLSHLLLQPASSTNPWLRRFSKKLLSSNLGLFEAIMLGAGFDQNVLVLIYETWVYEMRVNESDLVKQGRFFYLNFFFFF